MKTKKEMAEQIERLESQLKDIRKNQFNKYKFVNELEEEIKREIEKGNIGDEDAIQEYIDREIDTAVIYYRDCFEICMELNATHFEIEEIGITATDICQLAFYALREYVQNEIDISGLNEAIEAKQEIEE